MSFGLTNNLGAMQTIANGLLGNGGVNSIIGGVTTLLNGGQGSTTANTGNAANASSNAWQSQVLNSQNQMNENNAFFNLELQGQSSDFDNMMSERSEMLRESNTLRDAAMEQRKADNKITGDFIKSIG
jgi:urease alpha subunit